MKTLILLAMVLGLLMTRCGGYLVNKNKAAWANLVEHANVDNAKFEGDHEYCCSYTARMINTPFADGLGTVPSTYYYERCMKNKGYISKRDYHIYKWYEHKQFDEWYEQKKEQESK